MHETYAYCTPCSRLLAIYFGIHGHVHMHSLACQKFCSRLSGAEQPVDPLEPGGGVRIFAVLLDLGRAITAGARPSSINETAADTLSTRSSSTIPVTSFAPGPKSWTAEV